VTARFADLFAAARNDDRGVFLPYMMCGLFEDAATVALFGALTDAGADGFEVGIPYADPLMDGPVIQQAGAIALERGMTLEHGIDLAAAITEATARPVAVMTYVNPVIRMGLDRFARSVAGAGADAVIIADLPVDESEPFVVALERAGVGLVQFAAPTTTDARLDRVVASARPFVYGIAEMGVTGERDGSTSRAAELAVRVRSRSDVPLVFGVGISTPEAAAEACAVADGVIVGSALVRRVLEAGDAASAQAAASSLASEITAAVAGS
jgi:tryptophan synthase alpha chain